MSALVACLVFAAACSGTSSGKGTVNLGIAYGPPVPVAGEAGFALPFRLAPRSGEVRAIPEEEL